MEIKVTKIGYADLMKKKPKALPQAKKPNWLFRTLLKIVSLPDLWAVHFQCRKNGMEKLSKKQPCFILMNHSSFIDLEIVSSIFYPRPLNIVATWDGFIGRNWLMREIGCLQTKKFMVGPKLIRDMKQALKRKTSVVMFPEAGYSFDGTATTIPESLGKCVKLFGVPLVSVITQGAFHRQPLYNNLKKRKVDVSADMTYLLSPEEIEKMSVDEINAVIAKTFSFDNFRHQRENGIIIDEPDRAEGLNRVLYKCPHCLAEGQTVGAGTRLTCKACGKSYELTTLGAMQALDGETEIDHIPNWYAWERKCAREELEKGGYRAEYDVDVMVMVDSYHLYDVGEGKLIHDEDGFHLTASDGELNFTESATASYSVNSDFFWYQLADTVCVGDLNVQYYCFPKAKYGDVVAKERLIAEELFKIKTKID